jgi:hypothetical protein
MGEEQDPYYNHCNHYNCFNKPYSCIILRLLLYNYIYMYIYNVIIVYICVYILCFLMKTWELYVWRIFWDEMLKNLRFCFGRARGFSWDVMWRCDAGYWPNGWWVQPQKSQQTYDWVHTTIVNIDSQFHLWIADKYTEKNHMNHQQTRKSRRLVNDSLLPDSNRFRAISWWFLL